MGNKIKLNKRLESFIQASNADNLINADAVKAATGSAPTIEKVTVKIDPPAPVSPTIIPIKPRNSVVNTSKKGCPEGFGRVCMFMNDKHSGSLKALKAWTNLPVYQVLNEILDEYFEGREVKPLPETQGKGKKEKLESALKTAVNK